MGRSELMAAPVAQTVTPSPGAPAAALACFQPNAAGWSLCLRATAGQLLDQTTAAGTLPGHLGGGPSWLPRPAVVRLIDRWTAGSEADGLDSLSCCGRWTCWVMQLLLLHAAPATATRMPLSAASPTRKQQQEKNNI